MKHIGKYCIALMALIYNSLSIHSQTLHTIVFCNTIDESIGLSMSYELKNVTNQFKTINNLIDYDMNFTVLEGKDCTRTNLKEVVDGLYVEENDVILTFYGGHGSHAENNENDPWPQYCMNTGFENQNNWVPMASLAKWIQNKNPRLAIIISNCCNVVQKATTVKPLWAMGGDYTSLAGKKAENYKKLFGAKGLVMVTSSKVPEPSWCRVPDGGLFTCDFIQVLNDVGAGRIESNWDAVLKATYDLCSNRVIIDREGQRHKQHPYYEVKLGTSSRKIVDKKDRKDSNQLGQALLDVVNKNINQSTRLAMIPSILATHFSKFSKVLTIASDMETAVDYENPEDFLRRICLSPYITQVNIITEEDGVLTVHEVRTK